jgi:thiol-disulfide isomerase/thioredoxin
MPTSAFIIPSCSNVDSTKCQANYRRLNQIASPLEEMEQQENNEIDVSDKDWTRVAGGFLPKLRSSPLNGILRNKPQITEVSTLEEYKREVIECEEELVVVKFYSSYCRSCKNMAPLFRRLANKWHGDGRVKFVQVPVTKENAVLHQGLRIPSVPYGHIYHKEGGLVEEHKINKKEFEFFSELLDSYLEG